MPVTSIAFGLSIYEMVRWIWAIGPLPEANNYVIVWALFFLIASIIGGVGSYVMSKGVLLAGCLIFCAALAPVTPCLVVLTNGVQ